MPERADRETTDRERRDAVDFFSGTQPLCQWFRSIFVFLDSPENGDGSANLAPEPAYLAAVGEWLTGYDAWYRRIYRLRMGLRIRLSYHRQLSTFGSLSHLEGLCELARLAHRFGLGFAYGFDAEELCAHPDSAKRLIEMPGFSAARIRIHRGTPRGMAGALATATAALMERGVSVSIAASAERLAAFGLLEDPRICSGIVRVSPTGRRPTDLHPIAGAPSPCALLFQVYISRRGGVYPCRGLLDAPAARLGSVYEPFDESVFAGRATDLDLRSLASRGPDLETAPKIVEDPALPFEPYQCERHRAELLAAPGAWPRRSR